MIYFTEDDDSIRELVIYTLNSVGLEARGFARPSEFWSALKTETPDLILLDIMLPEEDGLEMLRKIRASSLKKLPVMMLTAKSSEYDKVVGLNGGADDYLAKPFGMMELVARIRALLRRTENHVTRSPEYALGKLYVCPAKHIVRVDAEDVSLTLKEFDLLCLLLQNRGIVLTRDAILNQIWGYSFDGESRTVDVHIRTLRQKLGPAGEVIETVRGIGYKIGE
ncbi:MAG: response regulator transcription factor [Clostridia bacterium]